MLSGCVRPSVQMGENIEVIRLHSMCTSIARRALGWVPVIRNYTSNWIFILKSCFLYAALYVAY